MKKIVFLFLSLSACSRQVTKFDKDWTDTPFWVNHTIEEQVEYLTLKSDCLEAQQSLDQEDIWLAARGQTREKLPEKQRESWPLRLRYDQQNRRCRVYAEYMCWVEDKKNPVERCKNAQGMVPWN